VVELAEEFVEQVAGRGGGRNARSYRHPDQQRKRRGDPPNTGARRGVAAGTVDNNMWTTIFCVRAVLPHMVSLGATAAAALRMQRQVIPLTSNCRSGLTNLDSGSGLDLSSLTQGGPGSVNPYQIEHLFTYRSQLAPPLIIGPVPGDVRIDFPIVGGEIAGPRLQGSVKSRG
jgi:hypothetical protein